MRPAPMCSAMPTARCSRWTAVCVCKAPVWGNSLFAAKSWLTRKAKCIGCASKPAHDTYLTKRKRGKKMTAVNKVLVIGGGFSGMAAAIQMRRAGIAVDLVEIDPHWQPLGAGITISGPTLRALQTLGVYEQVCEQGWVANGVEICIPTGQKVADLPTPQPVGSNVAAGGG